MSKKDVANLLAMAVAMGAGQDIANAMDGRASDYPTDTDSEFVKQSKALRRALNPRLFYSGKHPYCRPIPKTHKGKKAVRAAKRAKVAAMKAAGHVRGTNTAFEGI